VIGGLRITARDLSSARRWAERGVTRAAEGARKQLLRLGEPLRIQSRPVFILGCQRSGTTMLARALGRSPYVDVIHENDSRAFRAVRLRERAITVGLLGRSRARAVVFKAICDSHLALRLLCEHNDARAIWIYRRVDDVARSAARLWGDHFLHAVRTVLVEPRHAGWYGEHVTDGRMKQLTQLWRPDLGATSGAALVWWLRNSLYFDLQLETDRRVLLVSYDELCSAPERVLQSAFSFVELPWERRAIRGIGERDPQSATSLALDARIAAACRELGVRLDAARLRPETLLHDVAINVSAVSSS